MYKNHKILDGHIHYSIDLAPEHFVSFLDRSGTDLINLAVITRGKTLPDLAESLALKALYPGRFYVSGSLDPLLYYRGGDDMGSRQVQHAKRILELGCDGIKLLEGKPQLRKGLPIPDFDESCWEVFWQFVEETQTPLLWHVNDPASFWDREHIPDWAARMGWFYDESFINNESQYTQVLHVLERHPGLRVCFAHVFFMSENLGRLGDILARYENVSVDLTPGIEMYDAFSKAPAETADFFSAFHDRILYGTDIGSRFVYGNRGKAFDEQENTRRHEIVRAFLFESEPLMIRCDGHFVHDRPDFEMIPLSLSKERLDEILSGNYIRFIGGKPKMTEKEAVLEECRLLRRANGEAVRLGFNSVESRLTLTEKYLAE